jgi:CRP-like cAMP-binding protein
VATASDRARKNGLLWSLSKADFTLLKPHLETVVLPLRLILEESQKPIRHVYFPEAGIVSIVASGAHKREIEVGIIGREGMTGINVLLGSDRSPNRTYMQVAGSGQRITASHLREALEMSASLQRAFLRFVQTFMQQTAHTVLANGQGTVEMRLARWLLMGQDRIDGNELSLTHEFLALMLSVRRPGVTLALQELERRALIQTKRSVIIIRDRDGLIKLANRLYGVPEAEYRRLIAKGAQ